MVARFQFGLHGLYAQFLVELEVGGNLRGRVDRAVTPRKTLEEALNLGFVRAAGLAAHLFEQRHFVGSMQAVAVQRAAEVIRGRYKKLP